jgi:hypothetical protein
MTSPEQQTYEWRPAKLLQDYNAPQDFALLILNQPIRHNNNLRKLWKNCMKLHTVSLNEIEC